MGSPQAASDPVREREWQRKNRAPLPFATVAPRLQSLLEQFGPKDAGGPEDPFWGRRRNRVWELGGVKVVAVLKSASPPAVKVLRDEVTGQFSAEVRAALERSPELVPRIARAVLDAHFPESLHADILAAVGLTRSIAPVAGCVTRIAKKVNAAVTRVEGG